MTELVIINALLRLSNAQIMVAEYLIPPSNLNTPSANMVSRIQLQTVSYPFSVFGILGNEKELKDLEIQSLLVSGVPTRRLNYKDMTTEQKHRIHAPDIKIVNTSKKPILLKYCYTLNTSAINNLNILI